jgi:16S rRNA (cytosine1402-N4)-methyltransferase
MSRIAYAQGVIVVNSPETPPTVHVPVMSDEVLKWLDPQPGQRIVDGTFGGGGHARQLVDAVGDRGLVIGIDRDPRAIAQAVRNPAFTGLPLKLVQASYGDLSAVLQVLGVEKVDAVLLDLGISSDQLNDSERGFSFALRGPLDLRFNTDEGRPAWQLLEQLKEKQLADLIFQLGEERYSRRIARAIVERRKSDPVRRSDQLADLVYRCYPAAARHGRIHPTGSRTEIDSGLPCRGRATGHHQFSFTGRSAGQVGVSIGLSS